MNTINIDKIIETTSKLTLLYIQDEHKKINSTTDIIASYFKSMILAKDEKDALEKAKIAKVDFVLIDKNLDKININNLLEEMKKRNEDILSIVLLRENTIDKLLNIISLDIDAHILEEINKDNFLIALKKVVNKYLLKKEAYKNKNKIFTLEQYCEVVNSSVIVSKTNKQGVITYANDNFCNISEYSRGELVGQNHNVVRHPDNSKEMYKNLWDTISVKQSSWTGIIKNLSKSGKTYYVKSTIKPIFGLNGEVIEYIGLRNNVSAVMNDKRHLFDKIESNNLSLLALIQIEDFDTLDKFYNITTVEKIEKLFGYELLSYLPNEDLFDNVYNIGGGRYALLIDFFSYANTVQNVNAYFEELSTNVKKSLFMIDGIEYDLNVVISYSFGKLNLYEDAKCGLVEAIKKKDSITYSNDLSIKDHIDAKKNMAVMKMVKIALDKYNIVSYFQPIIDNKTKKIAKYESLVRLINEKGEILAPAAFLDVAKKGSYYNKITHRVLENSFKILEKINTKISINISALDIEKEPTRKKIYELLDKSKDDSSRVIFELLEDENIKDFSVIKDFIRKVKLKGVQIAIDDFGVGYSNFERLLDFEPDILKIDGSLIKNIVDDKYSRDVVQSIVDFAKKQNIETIAEFVENEDIFNILTELGIDYSQGYYFGKPENLSN